MCDHLSIILGARGDSCKFSAPGRTITGPASDLILSSLHCHALTHCALVPRPARPQGDKKLKTRAKSLMDAKWWAGVQWWPITGHLILHVTYENELYWSCDLGKSVTVETLIKTNWNYPKESGCLGKTRLVQSSQAFELVVGGEFECSVGFGGATHDICSG